MSTQQGMITDADGDIAALVYATGDRPDLVLLDFARHVSDSGRRICGLIQFRDRRSDDTRRRVMVLDAWTEVDVSHETSTVGGGHCHVDEGWMDRMAAQVRASIRDGVDAVIVNRFGPLEAAGGGFCDAIRVASETQTPLIIAVPAFEFERWTRCSNGMTVRLDCALDPVREWWHRVSTRNPRMLASELRACELLK
jgi:nucleoside-triphosphatase THEP1